MNRKSHWIALLALGMTYVAGCGGGSNNNGIFVSITQAPPGILAPGATAQVTATVTGDSSNSGVSWSCTPVNVCGSFSPMNTMSGMPTTYMAPPTPPATEPVAIVATSVKNSVPSTPVNVTISTSGGLTGNYSFYLSGFDGSNVYSLAGSVAIAANGSLTGEQDYNDGNGLTSPSGGDMITGGNLSFDSTTGLGTLTLITNNNSIGTETLSLNFVNNNHALVIEADGFATSSGSFDLQMLSNPLSTGGFSFALSGADSGGNTDFFGGVFSLSGTSVTNGIFDENDAGNASPNNSFTATLSAADTFGRGTLTGTGISNTIAYYIVGPEAIRLIDVDTNSTLVGSAFGQGSGNFTIGSQNSVFSVQSNLAGNLYSAIGEIFPTAGNFTGVADINEATVIPEAAVAISGTYSVGTNGYGNLIITSGNFEDVSTFGIYATDPNLNINDPNNTTSGSGGALVVDLDNNVAGSGVMVPQTDNATASFAGNYAVGLQDTIVPIIQGGEFDFVGNATATGTSFSGAGVISDPSGLLSNQAVDTTANFTSTIQPDLTNQGRYVLNALNMNIDNNGTFTINYGAVVYQASGGQLFWMENGADQFNTLTAGSVFSGQLQQQTLPLGADAKRAAAKKTKRQ